MNGCQRRLPSVLRPKPLALMPTAHLPSVGRLWPLPLPLRPAALLPQHAPPPQALTRSPPLRPGSPPLLRLCLPPAACRLQLGPRGQPRQLARWRDRPSPLLPQARALAQRAQQARRPCRSPCPACRSPAPSARALAAIFLSGACHARASKLPAGCAMAPASRDRDTVEHNPSLTTISCPARGSTAASQPGRKPLTHLQKDRGTVKHRLLAPLNALQLQRGQRGQHISGRCSITGKTMK